MLKKTFILDADLVDAMKLAEEGCLNSQIALASAFGEGIGAKKDVELAAHYEAMIFDSSSDLRVRLGVLWNLALREREKGNYALMKEKFQIVIDFMQENIPMEEWDFSLFDYMESYTQD